MKKHGKRYGDTNTHLTLSPKAQRIYSNSQPLDIYEEENGTYTVNLFGDIQEGLTESEVNTLLENLDNDEYTDTAAEIIAAGNYNAAVMLMDDEIRETVHADIAPCTDIEFLAEYMKRHAEKYGVDFIVC
jgi:hypothetical protein